MFPPSSNRVKVVVIGDRGVGKTSLINQYINNKFFYIWLYYNSSRLLLKKVEIDRINLTLQIWDTTITVKRVYERLVFKGVNYFILVFDVTDSMTFNNLNIWLNEINDIFGPSGIPLCVVGNKVDINDRREVCEEEARKCVIFIIFYILKLQPKLHKILLTCL